MEAVINSVRLFSEIAKYGMVNSRDNIAKNDILKVENDFSSSIEDLGHSYNKVTRAKDEQ